MKMKNKGWNPMDRIIHFEELEEEFPKKEYTHTESFLVALFISMMVIVGVVYTTPLEHLSSLFY